MQSHPSSRARAEEGERIVNWAFRQFSRKKLAEAGEPLAHAPVWMGDKRSVALVAASAVELVVPASVRDHIKAEIRYTGPITAPVEAGQELGELIIPLPDMEAVHIPLVAAETVARGGFVVRLGTALRVLYTRAMSAALAPG